MSNQPHSQDIHSNYYVPMLPPPMLPPPMLASPMLPPPISSHSNGSDTRYPYSLKSPSVYQTPTPGFNNNFTNAFPQFHNRTQYIKPELHQGQPTPFPHNTMNNLVMPSSFADINGAILKTDHNLMSTTNNMNPMDLTFWTSQASNWNTPDLYNSNTSNNSNTNLIEDNHSPKNLNLRYQIVLEAPTANNINLGDQPITYLNKSQYYSISLQDQQQYDGIIKTSIILQFYKPEDRKEATKNWERWFQLQSSNKSINTITVDSNSSSGIIALGPTSFDRINITWNGRQGARLALKLNCLSTDFIEVKGVSGKPLRLMLHSTTESNSEYSFAQIKIYRDKGAERKNMEGNPQKKLKSNKEDANCYQPSFKNTFFYPVHWDNYDDIPLLVTNQIDNQLNLPIKSNSIRDRKFNTLSGAEFPDLIGIDPSYIPHLRPTKNLPCLFIKSTNQSFYLPIHLHRLTLVDLIEKVANQFHLQSGTISSCTRRNLDGVLSQFNDHTVSQLLDEMDMILDITYLPKSMALTFQY